MINWLFNIFRPTPLRARVLRPHQVRSRFVETTPAYVRRNVQVEHQPVQRIYESRWTLGNRRGDAGYTRQVIHRQGESFYIGRQWREKAGHVTTRMEAQSFATAGEAFRMSDAYINNTGRLSARAIADDVRYSTPITQQWNRSEESVLATKVEHRVRDHMIRENWPAMRVVAEQSRERTAYGAKYAELREAHDEVRRATRPNHRPQVKTIEPERDR